MLCWFVVFIYLFVFFWFRLLQFLYYLYLCDFFSNYSSFVCSRFVRRCLTAAEAYLRSFGPICELEELQFARRGKRPPY